MRKLWARIIGYLYQKTIPKKQWKDGMEASFFLKGRNYYAYVDYSKLPPERLKRYQQLLSMIEKGFDEQEYSNLLNIAETCAQNCLDDMAHKRKMESMQALVYTVQELKSRKDDILFHPHLIMEVAAIVVLRDDEKDPNEINEEIHKEKARLFLVHGGQLDFFTANGIGKFIPNSREFLTGFQERLEIELRKLRLSQETFAKIAGEVSSLKSSNNGMKM